ncbi:uncharacterized protein LOC143491018 isoform X2 [Brachyhypopomus gauderio]|uniref:uncharacterized protein LOC143491018 isoform X2 n=1 Tax=Brachyhypopomus gauderio TaxID=698409 RepID=UPI004041E986
MITLLCWKMLGYAYGALCVGVCMVHGSKATEETVLNTSDCNKTFILPCNSSSSSHAYKSTTWYKVTDDGSTEGIIRRRHGTLGADLYPNYQNVASLTEQNSLVISNVSVRHAGLYKCSLMAKAGEKNSHSLVRLNVSECGAATPALLLPAVLHPLASEVPLRCTVMSLVNPKEISALWAFVGFSTFGVAKILLCALCLWVVLVLKKHRRRRTWN